jgi:cell division protein ZapA
VAHNSASLALELLVSERVKIQIYDQTYHIAGNLRPAYVEELAQYVDGKMREVARATGTVDSVRVAVLAALAIADELHALRQSRDESREKLRERAEKCLKLVERALQQSS